MRFPLPALLFSALAACTPAAETQAPSALAAAETDLMDRHDAAMLQTGRLFELKQQIGPPTPAAAPYVRGLQAADRAMLAWMNHYHPDTTAPEAQQLAYFRQQQTALAAVEKQLRGTLDSAATFLAQYPAVH